MLDLLDRTGGRPRFPISNEEHPKIGTLTPFSPVLFRSASS